jgi:enoyl-CoA hydratase/carnithine racemase
MSYVLHETDGPVHVITLNRPERRNALGDALLNELATAFRSFHEDETARVAILAANGPAFCAGMDMKESAERAPDNFRLSRQRRDNPFFRSQQAGVPPARGPELVKPVIAAVNGIAAGAGLFLCLNANLIVAATAAAFELSEVRRGIPVGWNLGAQLGLPRHLASELGLGLRISAGRAYEVGMVNRLVPAGRLAAEAMEIAGSLAAMPPLALRANIEMMARLSRSPSDELWQRGVALRTRAEQSDDVREAFAAFREKRPPTFTGH